MYAFIFIGRSGCGKGTQAELLKKFLESKAGNKVLYVETGHEFRSFIGGTGYSNKLSNEVYLSDTRQPDFLASYMWAKVVIDKITGEEHLIFDGTPRSLPEAKILETALKFYRVQKTIIIYLNVSRKWAEERLLARGVADKSATRRTDDDSISRVDKRLDWFDSDVLPAVWYFRNSHDFIFCDVNGEQNVESVHNDIVRNLPLDL